MKALSMRIYQWLSMVCHVQYIFINDYPWSIHYQNVCNAW